MKFGRRTFMITPERAIRFTKVSVLMTYIFAPSSSVKLKFYLFRMLMVTSVFLSVTFIMALVLMIIENSNKLVVVVRALVFICSLVNYITKVVIVRIYCEIFKVDLTPKKIAVFKIDSSKYHWVLKLTNSGQERLQSTLNNFVENADKFERTILQKYVNKSWKFQLFTTIGSYFTVTVFLLGPLVLPQKFPTDAVYPFSTENYFVAVIVYLHQSVGGYHASAAVVLDCQMAVYLWYLCVRFELLIYKIEYVENHHQLRHFIKKHQALLLFVEEIIPSIRAVVFSTVVINKFIMICAAVVLISSEAFVEKLQCVIILVFTALNVYTFIKPADRLIKLTSYGMSNKVFDIFWTLNLEMKKTCLLIIHRTQYPVVIHIPGFLQTVSNQYYSSFLSAAFSFFTAIRAVVNA